jgi:hypothetical protein
MARRGGGRSCAASGRNRYGLRSSRATAPVRSVGGRRDPDAPPGIGNAGRPAARVPGASAGEPPARVTRARRKAIRTKRLIFHHSCPGKQGITGRIRRSATISWSAVSGGNATEVYAFTFYSRQGAAILLELVGRAKAAPPLLGGGLGRDDRHNRRR